MFPVMELLTETNLLGLSGRVEYERRDCCHVRGCNENSALNVRITPSYQSIIRFENCIFQGLDLQVRAGKVTTTRKRYNNIDGLTIVEETRFRKSSSATRSPGRCSDCKVGQNESAKDPKYSQESGSVERYKIASPLNLRLIHQ